MVVVQSMGLLQEERDAEAVGQILRYCPGLNKLAIGELLGENDDFHLAVLDHFTRTFQFESAAALFSLPIICPVLLSVL